MSAPVNLWIDPKDLGGHCRGCQDEGIPEACEGIDLVKLVSAAFYFAWERLDEPRPDSVEMAREFLKGYKP